MSNNHDDSHHFIVPLKYYVGTFIGLLLLTFITVWSAQYDFGSTINIIIAMAIASVKASLVVGFFMGLHWDKGFDRIIFFSSLIFLGIFIVITWSDPATRGDIEPLEKGVHGIQSNVKIITDYDSHHSDSSH